MKTTVRLIGLIFMAFVLMLSSAVMAQYKPQSPIFGQDVQIFNYSDCTFAKSEIAVADNGWIYIVTRIDEPAINHQEWRVWRSTDEGVTFSYICRWQFDNADWILADVDIVVTGNDPSNIRLWVAELDNTGYIATNDSYCKVTKWDADGNYLGAPYVYDYAAPPNKLYYVSIATDYRSPGTGMSPFGIAVAYTGNWSSTDYLTYAYSLDGGATWDQTDLYYLTGTNVLGRVSLSLGGTASYLLGRYGVAFETNKTGNLLGDIGVLMNFTDNAFGSWTTPVLVNTTYSLATGKTRFPSIVLMDNVTANPANPAFFPMIIAYEDWSGGSGQIDLMYNSLKETYSMDTQASISDFSTHWIGSTNGFNDKEPNLSFDKTYNNFLLTYFTTDENKIPYAWNNIEGILSGNWAFYDNYRDATIPFTWQVAPKVDIDPTKANACFSWTEQNPYDVTQSIFFDAEWSTVGINDPAKLSILFSLQPNPAHDKVTVNIKLLGNCEVTVSDLLGQVLVRKTISERNNTLNIEGLRTGVYFVRVSGPGLNDAKKLIVN